MANVCNDPPVLAFIYQSVDKKFCNKFFSSASRDKWYSYKVSKCALIMLAVDVRNRTFCVFIEKPIFNVNVFQLYKL